MSEKISGDAQDAMHAAGAVPPVDALTAHARALGRRLQARGLMCCTAESCTGGLIGHLLTENAGSSVYFAGGAIVYSNAAKERVLGVRHATLLAHGAVSAQTAQEMAQGACRLYAAELAVSVTGIAGPGGGLPDKPTGTVFLHLSAADGYEQGIHHVWPADRSGNKLLSAQAALGLIGDYLEQLESS